MDAASVMEQYVADLNNLPAEIAYILEEISDKDSKFYDTRKRIQQRDNQIHKFIKANGTLADNPKETAAYPKIKADFDKAMELQEDKLDLAYTGLFIISRQAKKLNDEIKKLEDDGLLVPLPAGSSTSFNIDADLRKSLANGGSGSAIGAGNARSRTSSMNASAARSSPAPNGQHSSRAGTPASFSGPNNRPLKRARGQSSSLNDEHTPVHLPHPPKNRPSLQASNGDEDDVYCICQQPSFGNMVACDNPDCHFEWFHYGCVGLKEPPTGTWYCPDCTKREKRKKVDRG